jgi:hypothetical protein
MSHSVSETSVSEKPATTAPEKPPTPVSATPAAPLPAISAHAEPHGLAKEVALPPAAPHTQPQQPLLVMYQDGQGTHRIAIAGDGGGKWILPYSTEVEGLPQQGVHLEQKDHLTIANLGQRAEKPPLTMKNHAVFIWMPLDLAKVILGDQLREIDLDRITPAAITLPKVTNHPPQQTADAAVAAASTGGHAADCAGCTQCKAPPAAQVSGVAYNGTQQTPAPALAPVL